jgi:hypothetical protein
MFSFRRLFFLLWLPVNSYKRSPDLSDKTRATAERALTARFPLCYKRRSTVIVNAATPNSSTSALASLWTAPVAEENLP